MANRPNMNTTINGSVWPRCDLDREDALLGVDVLNGRYVIGGFTAHASLELDVGGGAGVFPEGPARRLVLEGWDVKSQRQDTQASDFRRLRDQDPPIGVPRSGTR